MKLYIVSPFSKREYDIQWLELNTPVGNFVIQLGHAPTILSLSDNKFAYFLLEDGKKDSIKIPKGIAEITRTDATILIHQDV